MVLRRESMTSRRLLPIAVMVFLSLLGGCRKRRPPAPYEFGSAKAVPAGPKKPAPKRTWETNYKMNIEGVSGEATFFAGSTANSSDDPWTVSAHFSLPVGTKIVMGKQSTTLTTSGWHTKVPIVEALAKAPAEEAIGKETDLGLSFTLDLPNYEAFEEKLPPQGVRGALAKGFGKIIDRPVTFPNESEKPGPLDGIVVVKGSHQVRLLGSSKTISDIDWIAIEETEKVPAHEKPCTGYDKPATLQMFDTEVKIYDRRTASVIAERKFAASSTCPSFAFVTAGKIASHVADDEVDKWARAELQKRKR